MEGIYEWDVAAGRLFLTERAKSFFAFAGDDLTAAEWNARVHPDDYAGYRAAIVEHFKGHVPRLEHEYRIVDKDGGCKWILDRGIGVRDADGVVSKLVGTLSDVTPRKLAEIEVRRSRDQAEEALEQQVATSEILRVISVADRHAADLRRNRGKRGPVVRRGSQRRPATGRRPHSFRCAAPLVATRIGRWRSDCSRCHRSGTTSPLESFAKGVWPTSSTSRATSRCPPRRATSLSSRAIGACWSCRCYARASNRCIVVAKAHGPFPGKQVTLLETFADQAVIAIENVRLFKELEARNSDLSEALEQQTATSDVLKVISNSAFDVQPVLDTVLVRAARLCGAEHAHVHRFDGELLRLAAGYSAVPEMLEYLREHPAPLGPGSISGLAGLERRPIHWPDVLAQTGYQRAEAQRLGGYRSILAVPMLKGDGLLGVIVIWKKKVEPFTEKQIELVATFADQAVIAIENVRLFKELEARTTELTKSVEELRALGDVGQAISSTLNVETVLRTIVSHATQLGGMNGGAIYEYDEAREQFHLHATEQLPLELIDELRANPHPQRRRRARTARGDGRAGPDRRYR